MKLITFNWCTKQIMEMKKRRLTPKPFFFRFAHLGNIFIPRFLLFRPRGSFKLMSAIKILNCVC